VPTFDYNGLYMNDFHRAFGALPLDGSCIQYTSHGRLLSGWLQRADAMKLYEMAYFAGGEILELGCYHGLSTSIMARAVLDSGSGARIESVDLDRGCTKATIATLKHQRLQGIVSVCEGDAVKHVQDLAAAERKFSFVFADHSHAYAPVLGVCQQLQHIVTDGGFCAFHDFNDPRNTDPKEADYGVYQAVMAGLDPDCFQFAGVFGCLALYRRTFTGVACG
jgi:predicted O-methyltransferase YrrM